MKEFFDKHKDQLSAQEKQDLWHSLASRRPRAQGTGQQSGTRLHRPRRLLWAYPALGVVATAVLVVVLLQHRNVPGLSQHRPDELVGNAARPAAELAAPQAAESPVPPVAEKAAPGAPAPQPLQAPAGAPPPQQDLHVQQDLRTKDLGPGPAAGARENEITSPLPVSATRALEPRPQQFRELAPSLAAPASPSGEVPAAALQAAEPGAVAGTPASTLSLPGTPSAAGTSRAAGTPGATGTSRTASTPGAAEMKVAAGGGPGIIQGRVYAASGKPLAYADIIVVGTSWGAFSLEDGSFTIPNIPSGTYTVAVSMIGYEDQKVEGVQVTAGGVATVRFEIKERPVGNLAEVEVVARREVIQERRGGTSHSIDSKGEGLPVNEPGEVIGLKAGVIARSDGLHFRGESKKKDAGNASDKADEKSETWGTIKNYDSQESRRPAESAPERWTPPVPVVPNTGGSKLPNDQVYDSMFFKHYGVNPFVATEDDALSTFAVDVDAASYTVARRYLELGHLPPPEAVRVEEFVNFFPQDYPHFTGPDFRIFMDGAPSPFGKGYQLLRIGLKARDIPEDERKPARLVFVIDVSGSMAREDRLELVKRALRLLVDQLRPDDRVGIVVFGTRARVLLDPVSAAERREILSAIDRLWPEGSTNTEEGLLLGYEMARELERPGAINRLILCSDGVANEGRTGAESILSEVRRRADKGIQLSTIGFGMGNYNDVLMEQLADQGDGSYAYVDNLDEARRVLVENLTGTLQSVARDAKVQVEFDPHRVLRYRLIGFENRDVADRDFRNDRVDAGEIGAGQTVTALYEVKLAPEVHRGRIATVTLRYQHPGRDGQGRALELTESLDASDLASRFGRAAPAFRLDAAVAEFAEILRGSYWAKESRLERIVPIAREAAGDLDGQEAAVEFVQLVERAADLQETFTSEERERIHPHFPDEGPDQRRGPDDDWTR